MVRFFSIIPNYFVKPFLDPPTVVSFSSVSPDRTIHSQFVTDLTTPKSTGGAFSILVSRLYPLRIITRMESKNYLKNHCHAFFDLWNDN